MKKILFFALLTIPTVIFAGSQLVLNKNTNTTHIWVFKNISKETIYLDHPHKPAAQAGWFSKLDAEHYSALAVNQKNFALSCEKFKPTQTLDCNKILEAVSLEQVTGKPITSTFWIGENRYWLPLWWQIHKHGYWKP